MKTINVLTKSQGHSLRSSCEYIESRAMRCRGGEEGLCGSVKISRMALLRRLEDYKVNLERISGAAPWKPEQKKLCEEKGRMVIQGGRGLCTVVPGASRGAPRTFLHAAIQSRQASQPDPCQGQ
jgi:hypothetical protein